jgi:hypothetical protein
MVTYFFLSLIDIRSLDTHGEKLFTKNNCTTFIISNKENLIHQKRVIRYFHPTKPYFWS